MAKPQLENGHTQIANEILERLAKTHLSPNQWQVMFCVIRKTYGFHKKVDYIANFQIMEATSLCKAVVSRCLKGLSDMEIITRKGKYIGFQKDWERWKQLAEQSTTEPKELPKRASQKDSRVSQSHKVSAWQARVFHRDGLTCQICGRDADTLVQANTGLHSHHIFPWEEYPELRFDVNNGLTMCDECHYCYHYANADNTYEYLKQVLEFKKLAVSSTIDKLAILHERLAISSLSLAEQSTKVSSPAVAQKIKETLTKDTLQKKEAPKKRYGEFNNVLLTDEQYNKLRDKYSDNGAKDWIEILSRGIASKGYKYKDHYATILNWVHRDEKDKKPGSRELPTTQQMKDEYDQGG